MSIKIYFLIQIDYVSLKIYSKNTFGGFKNLCIPRYSFSISIVPLFPFPFLLYVISTQKLQNTK